MTTLFIARGSYGDLKADPNTGEVLRYIQERSADGNEYADILCLDLQEWRERYPDEKTSGAEVDVLDVGFWTDTGAYCPAEESFAEWNADNAEWEANRKEA